MMFQRGRLTAVAGLVVTAIAISGAPPATAEPTSTQHLTAAESALNQALDSLTTATPNAAKDKHQVESEIAEKKREIEELERDKAAADANVETHQRQLDELRRELAELTKQLEQANASESVEQAVASATKQLEQANQAVAAAKQTGDVASIDTAQQRITAAEQALAESEHQLAELSQQTAGAASEVTAAETALGQARAAVDTAKQDLAAAEETLAAATKHDDAATAAFANQQRELEHQVETLQRDLVAAQQEVEQLNERASRLQQLTQQLEEDTAEFEEKSGDAELIQHGEAADPEELKAAPENLKKLRAELAELEKRINTVQQAVASNPQLKQALQDYTDAQTTVAEKLAKLAALDQEIRERDRAEQSRRADETTIADKQAELATLRERLNADEAKLQPLSGALDTLNSKIKNLNHARYRKALHGTHLAILEKLTSVSEAEFEATQQTLVEENDARVADLEQAVPRAREALKQAQQALDADPNNLELQKNVAVAREQLDQKSNELQAYTELSSDLYTTTSSSKTAKDALAETRLEAQLAEDQEANALRELEQARQPFAGAALPEAHIAGLKAAVAQRKQQIQALEEEIIALQGKGAAIDADDPDFVAPTPDLDNARAAAAKELEAARNRQRELRTAFENAAADAHEEDAANLVADLARQQELNQAILRQQSFIDYAYLQTLPKKIQELEQEQAEIKKMLEGKDAAAQRLSAIKQQLDSVTEQLTEHKQQAPALTAPTAQANVDELSAKVQQLQRDADQAQTKLDEAKQAHAESTKKLERTKQASIAKLDEATNNLALIDAALSADIEEHKLAGAKEAAAAAQSELERAQNELKELEKLRESMNTPKEPNGEGNDTAAPGGWLRWLPRSLTFIGGLIGLIGFFLIHVLGLKLW